MTCPTGDTYLIICMSAKKTKIMKNRQNCAKCIEKISCTTSNIEKFSILKGISEIHVNEVCQSNKTVFTLTRYTTYSYTKFVLEVAIDY